MPVERLVLARQSLGDVTRFALIGKFRFRHGLGAGAPGEEDGGANAKFRMQNAKLKRKHRYDRASLVFIRALSETPWVVDSRARRRWSSLDMRRFSLPL